MSTMNVSRTVATTVVFILILTLFFPLLTAAAAAVSKEDDLCGKGCSTENNGEEKGSAPLSSSQCSLPCCPILLCISAYTTQPLTCSVVLDKTNNTNFVEQFNIEPSTQHIFKPPKML